MANSDQANVDGDGSVICVMPMTTVMALRMALTIAR